MADAELRLCAHAQPLDPALLMNMMETVADKAAEGAAQRAVQETFFLLGVNLKDPTHVRGTRDTFLYMIDRFEARKERRETFRKGIILGFLSLIVTGLLAMIGLGAHSSVTHQ